MSKNQIILASVVVLGIVAIFTFGNFNNSNTENTLSSNDEHVLSASNLNY